MPPPFVFRRLFYYLECFYVLPSSRICICLLSRSLSNSSSFHRTLPCFVSISSFYYSLPVRSLRHEESFVLNSCPPCRLYGPSTNSRDTILFFVGKRYREILGIGKIGTLGILFEDIRFFLLYRDCTFPLFSEDDLKFLQTIPISWIILAPTVSWILHFVL